MKYAIAVSAACLIAAVSVSASSASAANDEAKIKTLEDQFAAAFNAKDLDGIMKVYAPDESLFVFDVIPPRQYVGASAYRKDWEGFLATFKGHAKMTLDDLAITNDGNLGFSRSTQHVTGTDTKGKPVDFTVRVTDGYKKTGGKWLIVQEHVSVPVNAETGVADMMSKP